MGLESWHLVRIKSFEGTDQACSRGADTKNRFPASGPSSSVSGFTTSGLHGAVYHLRTSLTCKQRIKHTYDCIFTCLQLHRKLTRRRHPLHVWNLHCGVSSNTYKTKKKKKSSNSFSEPASSPFSQEFPTLDLSLSLSVSWRLSARFGDIPSYSFIWAWFLFKHYFTLPDFPRIGPCILGFMRQSSPLSYHNKVILQIILSLRLSLVSNVVLTHPPFTIFKK